MISIPQLPTQNVAKFMVMFALFASASTAYLIYNHITQSKNIAEEKSELEVATQQHNYYECAHTFLSSILLGKEKNMCIEQFYSCIEKKKVTRYLTIRPELMLKMDSTDELKIRRLENFITYNGELILKIEKLNARFAEKEIPWIWGYIILIIIDLALWFVTFSTYIRDTRSKDEKYFVLQIEELEQRITLNQLSIDEKIRNNANSTPPKTSTDFDNNA